MKRFKKSSNKKNKSFFRSVLMGMIILLISLSFSRIVLSNILATSGGQLSSANQKIKILEEENMKIENNISSLGSLKRAEKFAVEKGYVKTKNVQVLVETVPIANK